MRAAGLCSMAGEGAVIHGRDSLMEWTADGAEIVDCPVHVGKGLDDDQVMTAQAQRLVAALPEFPRPEQSHGLNAAFNPDILRRAWSLAKHERFLHIAPVAIPQGGVAIQSVGGGERANFRQEQLA